MWTYQLRYVRCGKPTCRSCRGPVAHGPYWYGFRHKGDRVYSRYFGKRDPRSIHDDARAPEPETSSRWRFEGKMTHATALRILGFIYEPAFTELRTRYRTLMREHHPDGGGDTATAAAIVAAWQYMKPA